MNCGYDWTALFVGVLAGTVATTGFFCWALSWFTKPMNEIDIPTLTDEVEVKR